MIKKYLINAERQSDRHRMDVYTHTHEHVHSDINNTMSLQMTLCGVVVDGFLMKSGAVCLPYATHGFQPQRHRVGEKQKQNKDKKRSRE